MKSKSMIIIGCILVAIQILATVETSDFTSIGVIESIGFFLPGGIGVILLMIRLES